MDGGVIEGHECGGEDGAGDFRGWAAAYVEGLGPLEGEEVDGVIHKI